MTTPKHLLRLAACALLALTLAACGTDESDPGDTSDAASDASDAVDATTSDAVSDSASDTEADTASDTEADTEADTSADTTSDTSADVTGDPLEVIGTWESQFATTEVISAEAWAWMALIEFDNAANVAITQNPSDDMFNPDAFNRIVWTEPAAAGFAYCIVDFGLATADDARTSSASADDSDLDSGCGGFAWTLLTAAP